MYSLLVDNASHRLLARKDGLGARKDGLGARKDGLGAWSVTLGGQPFLVEAIDERTRTIREMTGAGDGPGGPKPVRAPMPGLVVKVEVEEGDSVETGQGVIIVEAMKMENELTAEAPGVVTRVHVVEGQTVEKDQVLIELHAPDEDVGSPDSAQADAS